MKVKDLIKKLQELNEPELYVHPYDDSIGSFAYDSVTEVTIYEFNDDEGDYNRIVVLK